MADLASASALATRSCAFLAASLAASTLAAALASRLASRLMTGLRGSVFHYFIGLEVRAEATG